MALYEITAEMNLEKMIAESREVAQALNEFADNLEQIEKKYAEPQENKKSEDKQIIKDCNNCSKRHECAGFIEGNYWCWRPEESEE